MKRPLWDRALEFLLEHEGGFVDHPRDPGGATKWGISLRLLRDLPEGDVDRDGDVDADDVRLLPIDVAAEIYRERFWRAGSYFRLPDDLAIKVFDLAVVMGPAQAHRLLQRALRATGAELEEDGILGPETFRAASTSARPEAVVAALREAARCYFERLVRSRPELQPFLAGWTRRALA